MRASAEITSRPAFRYFGGKFSLGSWIVSNLPEHGLYCEPFGGAMSVLLRKSPSTVDIYNDSEGDVVNFFRVLRDQPGELMRQIRLTPMSREECELSVEPAADLVERARRFYVRVGQRFNSANTGARSGWKFNRKALSKKNEARVWGKIEHLRAVAERLLTVSIEHDDAFAIIARYDSPSALFYVDPPYLPDTRDRRWRHRAYANEFSAVDHGALLEQLKSIEGKVVLSGYASPLYDEALAGWTRVTRMARTTGKTSKLEVLWIKP